VTFLSSLDAEVDAPRPNIGLLSTVCTHLFLLRALSAFLTGLSTKQQQQRDDSTGTCMQFLQSVD